MNEIQLSTRFTELATKINSHKNNIGYSFIEIGKELIRAKKEDVKHGEWKLFLKEIKMSKSQADRHIKISEEYEIGKLPNVGNIGFTAMYEIATLPEEKRNEAINEDGTAKSIREIRDLKKQNTELENSKQQAEQQAKQARQSEEIALKQLEELESKEPETIEKEVIPNYLNEEIEQLKRNAESSRNAYEAAEKELESYRLKNVNEFDEDEAKKELEKLHWEAEKSVYTFINKVDDFIESVAKFGFMDGEIATSSDATKKRLSESVEHLKEFTRRMETSLKGRIEI